MGACSSVDVVNPHFVDLSHFELMKVVGKGGFGKVNAVSKKDTGELMALKRMEKFAVLQSAAHLNMVWVERRIMSLQSSPFLCNLVYAFQSSDELFLLMPFMQGGDLRYHLREHGPLREADVRFYAAELLCGLADLHAKRVVFRDLKPENILLDAEGHLRISDFGLGCQLTAERRYRVSGQAGTKGYQAPEVLQNAHYGCEVDVFSYGIVIYELVHNQRPWRSGIGNGGGGGDNDEEAAADILARFKDLPLSSKLSPALASFLRAVLTPDWRQRIGCAPKKVAADGSYSSADQRVDWGQMKSHEFFAGIDWDMLYAKKVPPPFVPDNSRANCSPEADLADQLLDHKPRKITEEQQKNFEGWAFNTDLGTLPKPATTTTAAASGGADASTTAAGGAGSSAAAAGSNGVAAAAAPGHDQKQPTRPSPSPSPSPGQTAAGDGTGAGAAAASGGGRNSRRTTPLVTAPVIVAPAPVHVHAAPAAAEPVEAEA